MTINEVALLFVVIYGLCDTLLEWCGWPREEQRE